MMADCVSQWKQASERGDAGLATACLAEGIELISPLTSQYRFTGRHQLHEVLASLFEVITDIHFHTDIGDSETRALFYRGRVGKVELEEAQLLRLNLEGEISQLTLFDRPLPALTAVMAGIGPRMLRRQGKARLAPFIGAAAAPLAGLIRVGDARVTPLGDPTRKNRRRA